jgi:hypothetical protein
MQVWLLIAAAGQAAAGSNAGSAMRGLGPAEIGRVAAARALDLRLSQDMRPSSPLPLIRGMIVQRAVAANAAVGLGLSNLYERRKAGFDEREDGRPKRSRRPAITFLMKF